jgi:hypothetical protein
MAYCEISHKKGWTKGPPAVHGSLGFIFYPINKANITADCLKNQFIAHDLHDYDHRHHVKAQVKALLAAVNEEANPVTSQKKYNP